MGKLLSDMTLEELWELFSIILTEHNESWNKWYAEEERRLVGILPSNDIKIYHIGSTAIKDIWAKPIIDILVELPVSILMESAKKVLVQNRIGGKFFPNLTIESVNVFDVLRLCNSIE